MMTRFLRILTCSTVLIFGVAMLPAEPIWADESTAELDGPIFYPPPPDVPRLQFLAGYSSALDVASEKGLKSFLFGEEDIGKDFIEKPFGVAIHEGAIHVVDSRGFGWGVFDLANGDAYFVQPSGRGALRKPINITIDSDGTKYVTDTDRLQIVVFDANDKYVAAFGEGEQFKPADVAIAGDRLYVTDPMNQKVHVLNKRSGDSLFSFGNPGSDPGEFMHPTGITIASDGSVLVVDTSNFRIQRFNAEGEFEHEFGGQGTAPGRLGRPKGIAIDKEDQIYVVDAAFQNIQVMERKTGGALGFFGNAGKGPDSIGLPTVVKVDYDNVKYFEHLAAPGFIVEYLVLIVGQYTENSVVVLGYGSFDE
jgi:outer membrane protein assembly factor BamB